MMKTHLGTKHQTRELSTRELIKMHPDKVPFLDSAIRRFLIVEEPGQATVIRYELVATPQLLAELLNEEVPC